MNHATQQKSDCQSLIIFQWIYRVYIVPSQSLVYSLFSDVLRKLHEEQTSQYDKGVQELAEDKDEKSLESFEDPKLTGEKEKPMEDFPIIRKRALKW